jgi:hypothetical protein
VDGMTDFRDNNGCGPLSSDPRYGSKGYDHLSWPDKFLYRADIVNYKNTHFGENRTWQSIPCSDFIQPQTPNSTRNLIRAILGTVQENNSTAESSFEWKYVSKEQFTIDAWSYIMGHPVCQLPAPDPDIDTNPSKIMLLYAGPTSWYPEHWSLVVQLMEQTLDMHPLVGTWNELLLEVPPVEEDFVHQSVQAVFYVQGNGLIADEIARLIAKKEAKRMQKPLLFINLPGSVDVDGDLFHCPNDKDENDAEAENLSKVEKAWLRRPIQ